MKNMAARCVKRCAKRCAKATHLISIALLALTLGVTLGGKASATTRPLPQAAITVTGPAQVAVGKPISLNIRIEGSADLENLAGLELQLLFDRTAVEFAGTHLLSGPAALGQLVLPELANGAAFAFYSCSTDACLRVERAQALTAESQGGEIEVQLIGRTPGQVEIRLANVKAVDAAGRLLPLTIQQPSITVQVGEAGQPVPAPAAEWVWTPATVESAPQARPEGSRADLTHDGDATHADLMQVALAWQIAREDDAPCGGAPESDINGDGCIDIIDLQAAASSIAATQTEAAAPRGFPAERVSMTFTVNSALDEIDAQIGDGDCATASGVCTLRAAIAEANANPGDDTIAFAIPGNQVHTIQLASRLPALNDEDGGTLIDGYTQPGSAANTAPLVSNAQIRIEIRGQGFEAFDGLAIISANNTVRGLAFYDLRRSLWIYGSGAHDNVITGNLIGTDSAGAFGVNSTSPQQAHGVHIEQGAYQNQIGGALPGERNVISGNARNGVGLWHIGTDDNVIVNNIIGLSPDGLRRLANRQHGVDINYGAASNRVGGTDSGERNVISGNHVNGAELSHTAATSENRIVGNYIGTDVTGDNAPSYASNEGIGVSLHDRVSNNLVSGNVVGNNALGGVQIDDTATCCIRDNQIEGNRIGIGVDGSRISNRMFGIRLVAGRSQIGPDNIVAYNPIGIAVEGDDSDRNTITENSIFSNTGLGIDIAPIGQVNLNDADDLDAGANQQLNAPVLTDASLTRTGGTACGGCLIEIFIADVARLDYGEGRTFVGAGVVDGNGTFSVTLDGAAYGDYLTATATDADGNTSEFARNLLIANPGNQPPVATDDTALTPMNTPVTLDVLQNDSDPDGDPLSVVAIGQAANGDVTSDGAFVTYTPNLDFEGEDNFIYTASDNIGGTSVATVTVTVERREASGSSGVTVEPLVLSIFEGGSPATYTLALQTEPSSTVTVTIHAEGALLLDPASVSFDGSDWDVPQVITVQALDDGFTEGARTITIRHSLSSADSEYNNVGVDDVVVHVTDEAVLFFPWISR